MQIQAAFLHPVSKKIFLGENHYKAIENSGFLGEHNEKCEGFLIDGVFHTRQETYKVTGKVCLSGRT
jgi:hypothetical protein